MIVSGLGFSGWTTPDDNKVVKPIWTRAKNVDILRVEFAKSGAELPLYWNISTGNWLRHCMSPLQTLIVIRSLSVTIVCTINFRLKMFKIRMLANSLCQKGVGEINKIPN